MNDYHVSVEYTHWKGGTDFTEMLVGADSEEEAVEIAKGRPDWPDVDMYEEDEIEVRLANE